MRAQMRLSRSRRWASNCLPAIRRVSRSDRRQRDSAKVGSGFSSLGGETDCRAGAAARGGEGAARQQETGERGRDARLWSVTTMRQKRSMCPEAACGTCGSQASSWPSSRRPSSTCRASTSRAGCSRRSTRSFFSPREGSSPTCLSRDTSSAARSPSCSSAARPWRMEQAAGIGGWMISVLGAIDAGLCSPHRWPALGAILIAASGSLVTRTPGVFSGHFGRSTILLCTPAWGLPWLR